MKTSPLTPLSRRTFLAVTSLLPAAIAARVSAADTAGQPAPATLVGKRPPIGLELYSVRGELARDLPNTLNTASKMGYQVVKFYAPYFKWTAPYAKDVRTQMDDLGIRCYSTHNGIESFTPGDNFAHAIELNQILGARYIVLASARANGVDGW